jgi:hypothetical protein
MTAHKPILPLCICGDPDCAIPHGYCHCGCGEATTIPTRNNGPLGYIKGIPKKFIFNHHRKHPRKEDERVIIDGEPCVRISLTQGKFATIDEEDYSRVHQCLWFAVKGDHTYYAATHAGNRNLTMHRFIMNPSDTELVDHEHGDGLDNRKRKLRICNHSENMRNRSRMGKRSRFKGVYRKKTTSKYKWVASLHLGSFETEEEAARFYDRALMHMFDKFGKPNFERRSTCV